jgi:ESS family glutamate:Na+ symporter
MLFDIEVTFDLERRDTLLVYFFAALGLRFNPRELIANRRPLLILAALASLMILTQNVAGITVAQAFGFEPQVGVVAGSMALTGRSGTTVAWAPIFHEQFGLEGMSRLGAAVNMAGLLAACAIGGPIARYLITRHGLNGPRRTADAELGFSRHEDDVSLDHHAFLLALLRIHAVVLTGLLLKWAIDFTGILMPLYVTCLVGGILLGNVKPRFADGIRWSASDQCLTLIAYVSLGLFYSMALMSLQLWTAGEFLYFMAVVMIVQIAITIAFSILLVFRAMGGDYDSAVVAAGFAGISLGSTATTMAIMTAITNEYGRAHRALVIVPLTCGISVDIINSFAIAAFAMLH